LLNALLSSLRHLVENPLPGVRHLQNIHPLVVHFPVAFLFGAVLLYFLAWIARRESWAWTGLWMLGLGTLGVAVAVYTGLRAAEGVMIAPSVKEHLLLYHKRIMLAVMALSGTLTVWALIARPMPRRGRVVFMMLLLVMVALVAKGADYGGRMVYDYNVGGSLPQPIDFTE
jgi:uncharacterized membrane protein